MDKKERMDKAEQSLLHTYRRFPVILDHGEGVYLYDTEGKKYLDFYAGIAVQALGHSNKKYKDALINQTNKLIQTSNYYYNLPTIEAAEKILKASGMDRVFFTNSGAEAIEGALKSARKYFLKKTGKVGGEIIAMQGAFHGRTIGALSVTGTEQYRAPFEPLMGGVKFAEFNDLSSIKACASDNTCAVILETVQGESGIHPADETFLRELRAWTKEKGILLILDEIQCGMGRTGEMFAFQHYGVKPDIMTSAKALGCGVPVGAFLMTEETAEFSLEPGDHGSTYGGNALAGAAVSAVLDQFEELQILSHVKAMTPYLTAALDRIMDRYDFVTARRGLGFMQGLEMRIPVGEAVGRALEEGLILITAGHDVVRFVPPLVIEKKHIDEMEEKLTKTLDGFTK